MLYGYTVVINKEFQSNAAIEDMLCHAREVKSRYIYTLGEVHKDLLKRRTIKWQRNAPEATEPSDLYFEYTNDEGTEIGVWSEHHGTHFEFTSHPETGGTGDDIDGLTDDEIEEARRIEREEGRQNSFEDEAQIHNS
jgi:hypothetical protein